MNECIVGDAVIVYVKPFGIVWLLCFPCIGVVVRGPSWLYIVLHVIMTRVSPQMVDSISGQRHAQFCGFVAT
jgi:hypothetical protein